MQLKNHPHKIETKLLPKEQSANYFVCSIFMYMTLLNSERPPTRFCLLPFFPFFFGTQLSLVKAEYCGYQWGRAVSQKHTPPLK